MARHLADHLRVFLGFGHSDKKNVKDCLPTRNTSPDSLSPTLRLLSLEGRSGPGWGLGVEPMQSLLGTNTSLRPLLHSGCCLFFLTTWDRDISAIQDLPHELHPPRDVACLIGQTETEAWELPFQITLSYIQVLYPQS